MIIPIVRNFNGGRTVLLVGAGVLAVAAINAQTKDQVPKAQSPDVPQWQIAAGGKMSFEVASIKPGAPFVPPTFALDGVDAIIPTGGRFTANFPLVSYIMFAYKYYPAPEQRQALSDHLPGWAHSPSEWIRYTIEAKAEGNNPTKDQFRLMMQSLLADRFKVVVHWETQQGPMLALTLAKPNKLGPKLRPHAEGPPCDAPAVSPAGGPSASGTDVWPPTCGGYSIRPAPDRMHLQHGSRNTTMALLAGNLPNVSDGALTLPVVDQTGLSGNFDFTIEFAPEATDVAGAAMATLFGVQPDPQGPAFVDALREQLGLKLVSIKGPVQVLVIDHVEKPSEN
jgi:bla regulator protein BlaR1